MEFYCKRQQLMLTFHSSEHNIQIVEYNAAKTVFFSANQMTELHMKHWTTYIKLKHWTAYIKWIHKDMGCSVFSSNTEIYRSIKNTQTAYLIFSASNLYERHVHKY